MVNASATCCTVEQEQICPAENGKKQTEIFWSGDMSDGNADPYSQRKLLL